MNKQAIKRGCSEVVNYMMFHPYGIFVPSDIGRGCRLKRWGSCSLGAQYYLKKLRRRGIVERIRFRDKPGLGYRFTVAYLKETARDNAA